MMMLAQRRRQIAKAILSGKVVALRTSPLSINRLPIKGSVVVQQRDELPGHTRRTVLDTTRKQPEYDSPYAGPEGYNPNTSGVSSSLSHRFRFNLSTVCIHVHAQFDDTYDLWWDDGVQREYTYFDDTPWIARSDTLMWTLYFFGWAVALWTFYKYFLIAPANSLHPMVRVYLTDEQREKAERLRDQRRQDMEKFEIEQK